MINFSFKDKHWEKKICEIAQHNKKVAIVIPGTSKENLTKDEEISFSQLQKHLSEFDTFFLLPKGSKATLPNTQNVYLPKKYFGSALRHGHLLFRESFYKRFEEYDYIFFYHLDALVLGNELLYWCDQSFDFIGAPWFPSGTTPWVEKPFVGNGGFALLRVSSALKSIYSRYKKYPSYQYLDIFGSIIFHFNHYRRKVFKNKTPKYLRKLIKFEKETSRNDLFWSRQAVKFYPEFKVADVDSALRFAFEVDPQACFERNNNELPFGCHAWARYDRAFWIEKMNNLSQGAHEANKSSSI